MSEEVKVENPDTNVETTDGKGWGAAAPSKSGEGKGLLSARGKKTVHKEVLNTPDEESALEVIPGEYSVDDKILFYKERECLLLLLEARKLLSSMVTRKEIEMDKAVREKRRREKEAKERSGRLTVQEIMDILQNSQEEDDYDMVSG